MSDIQKTINILNKLPESVAVKISMREISEILSIMFGMHENDEFEPTIEDFIEALYVRTKIREGLKDIENGNLYTTEELKKELGI